MPLPAGLENADELQWRAEVIRAVERLELIQSGGSLDMGGGSSDSGIAGLADRVATLEEGNSSGPTVSTKSAVDYNDLGGDLTFSTSSTVPSGMGIHLRLSSEDFGWPTGGGGGTYIIMDVFIAVSVSGSDWTATVIGHVDEFYYDSTPAAIDNIISGVGSGSMASSLGSSDSVTLSSHGISVTIGTDGTVTCSVTPPGNWSTAWSGILTASW